MRGLLVVNPAATVTTERTRDVLASALAADIALEVTVTKGRGHAIELGQRAVESGLDLVIALGGDGTVNEIVNGMLGDGPSPSVPALAVVPGGSTNVFARALGYSRLPVEAAGELLAALRKGRSRRITLGTATFSGQSRWFTFCAGIGLDADVVAEVERKRRTGRRNTAGLYMGSAARLLACGRGRGRGRSSTPITVRTGVNPEVWAPTTDDEGMGSAGAVVDVEAGSAGAVVDVEAAVVCNTCPWTYLDARPVRACPQASFEGGLDLLGIRRVRILSVARTARQMLYRPAGPRGRNLAMFHDEPGIALTAPRPVSFQVDGEYLGKHDQVYLHAEPSALRVIA
jgi:diacylglycerol kinase family enzyme